MAGLKYPESDLEVVCGLEEELREVFCFSYRSLGVLCEVWSWGWVFLRGVLMCSGIVLSAFSWLGFLHLFCCYLCLLVICCPFFSCKLSYSNNIGSIVVS